MSASSAWAQALAPVEAPAAVPPGSPAIPNWPNNASRIKIWCVLVHMGSRVGVQPPVHLREHAASLGQVWTHTRAGSWVPYPADYMYLGGGGLCPAASARKGPVVTWTPHQLGGAACRTACTSCSARRPCHPCRPGPPPRGLPAPLPPCSTSEFTPSERAGLGQGRWIQGWIRAGEANATRSGLLRHSAARGAQLQARAAPPRAAAGGRRVPRERNCSAPLLQWYCVDRDPDAYSGVSPLRAHTPHCVCARRTAASPAATVADWWYLTPASTCAPPRRQLPRVQLPRNALHSAPSRCPFSTTPSPPPHSTPPTPTPPPHPPRPCSTKSSCSARSPASCGGNPTCCSGAASSGMTWWPA